jgi:hypothetical protein
MSPFDDVLRAWAALPHRKPGELTDARLQAHWAVQLIDVVGRARVPAQEDWGHLAMTWLDPLELLAGGFTSGGVRVALRVRDLCLVVLDADDRVEWSLCLDGRTLAEAREWLKGVLAEEGETAPGLEPFRKDLPAHPVAEGAPFRLDEWAHFQELSQWFGNCARIFQVLAENTAGAAPPRCWPHHFDLATLVTLDADDPDPETARSINVGLSPGDESYDEPYLYVTPWPTPPRAETEPLAGGGHWHTEGFTAAVLPAHRLPEANAGDDPDFHAQEQAEQVFAFLRSAMAACRGLLGVL